MAQLPASNSTTACPRVAEIFLATKAAEGRAVRTLGAYRDTLGRFYKAVRGDEILTPDHIVEFLAGMRREGLSPGSINHYQRGLYTYLRWLYERGDLERDITRQVKMVSIPREQKRTVREGDMTRMLSVAIAPEGRHNKLRNIALLRLLWDTGVRVGELLALDLDDLDERRGLITIAGATSKTREYRRVPFTAETKLALLEYIERERLRPRRMTPAQRAAWSPPPGALFVTRTGDRLTYEAVRRVLTTIGTQAEVQFSPHDFRRGRAADSRRKGIDLGSTMKLLGHKSPVMTLAYSEDGEQDAAIDAYRKLIG